MRVTTIILLAACSASLSSIAVRASDFSRPAELEKVLEQRWTLTRSAGRPIVMVCRYHGTDATVRKEVPPDLTECRLEGLISEQGEIQCSPTLTCR